MPANNSGKHQIPQTCDDYCDDDNRNNVPSSRNNVPSSTIKLKIHDVHQINQGKK